MLVVCLRVCCVACAEPAVTVALGADLFRDGVKPMWEDPGNADGGKVVVRVKKGLSSHYWEMVLLAIIGGQLEPADDVCGAVLGVRFHEDTLSIWNKDANNVAGCKMLSDSLVHVLNLPGSRRLEYKCHDRSKRVPKSAGSGAGSAAAPSGPGGLFSRRSPMGPKAVSGPAGPVSTGDPALDLASGSSADAGDRRRRWGTSGGGDGRPPWARGRGDRSNAASGGAPGAAAASSSGGGGGGGGGGGSGGGSGGGLFAGGAGAAGNGGSGAVDGSGDAHRGSWSSKDKGRDLDFGALRDGGGRGAARSATGGGEGGAVEDGWHTVGR